MLTDTMGTVQFSQLAIKIKIKNISLYLKKSDHLHRATNDGLRRNLF